MTGDKVLKWRVRTPQGIHTGVEIAEIKPPASALGRWWKIVDQFGEFDVWPEGQIMVEGLSA
jgi:hypothetical protein